MHFTEHSLEEEYLNVFCLYYHWSYIFVQSFRGLKCYFPQFVDAHELEHCRYSVSCLVSRMFCTLFTLKVLTINVHVQVLHASSIFF